VIAALENGGVRFWDPLSPRVTKCIAKAHDNCVNIVRYGDRTSLLLMSAPVPQTSTTSGPGQTIVLSKSGTCVAWIHIHAGSMATETG